MCRTRMPRPASACWGKRCSRHCAKWPRNSTSRARSKPISRSASTIWIASMSRSVRQPNSLEAQGCRRSSVLGNWPSRRLATPPARPCRLHTGKGIGRVTFTAEGRMMSVVCDGRPELPAGTPREYSSYCGNYTFDGARLVTRVDAASDPSRIGSDQVPRRALRGRPHDPVPAPASPGRERGIPRVDLGTDCGGITPQSPLRSSGSGLSSAAESRDATISLRRSASSLKR